MKRLGVIGTFVWDTIHGRGIGSVEEWGGITYSLAALDAALDDDWQIVPLIKVGSDLTARAREFTASLTHIAPDAALIEVAQPNNRVEIVYESSERRCEKLTGGLPGWTWLGLKPLLKDIDALYINFLSGWELDLETAQLLRQHFKGPIYCDLHMLVMAVQPEGWRALRPLPNAAEWCRCFDLLQMNDEEVTASAPDPMALAATALAHGVRALFVTLGPRGAVYFAAPGFDRLSDLTRAPQLDRGAAGTGPIRTELVNVDALRQEGDPTGCGDVWGATCFSRLLHGDTLRQSIDAAHAAAARNVAHRGATGLTHHLRGEISSR